MENKVFFKGSLAVEQMVRVIENADLGVVPKRNNGFGNEAFSTKILEFMAMRVPVIVLRYRNQHCFFDENVVKFFRQNDPKSLADAMLLVIKNPAIRENLMRNANKIIRKYTWDVNERIFLDLVDSLLEARNNHGAASR